ncbi:MAG TPA: LysM domain-containing protein [Acidimicrobiia bacterium]|jgi:hypothetical protein
MTTTTIPMPTLEPYRRPQRTRPVTAPTTRPSRAVYRRRRAVVALAGALFVLAGARAADAVTTGSGRVVQPTQKVVHYEVKPGDTLWSIAHTLAPSQDPREVVDLLAQAHGSATIQPGDVINWAGN